MADKHKSKSLQERHPQAKPELYAPVPDKEAEAGTENTQIKDTCKGGIELEPGSKPDRKPDEKRPDVLEKSPYTASVLGGQSDSTAQQPEQSFADLMYEQINNVLGGNSRSQFLCLTIPGQPLLADDFAYDYKNSKVKGPVVEANESKLVNKLFDPCRLTGADNGLTLPHQYRTALDMLAPMLNGKLAEAKNKLRQLLLTRYDYDFKDGSKKEYTLQEVFFKLYDEWIQAKEKWAEDQNTMKQQLMADGANYSDEYLAWYEQNAECRIGELNEKLAKVITVFTPNDMLILEGVLDSGSGAQLQEARQTLLNVQKLTPDGGTVYPVKLNPANWFEMLSTSFTPADLLQDPDVLAMQLQSLSVNRIRINERIDSLSSLVPAEEDVADSREKLKTAKNALGEAQKNLLDTYGNGIKEAVQTLFDLAPLFEGGAVPAEIILKLLKGKKLASGKTAAELAKDLSATLAQAITVQRDYTQAVQNLSDAAAKEVELRNLSSLRQLLFPLREKLKLLNAQIRDIQTQIQISASMRPQPDENGKVTDPNPDKSGVTPHTVPEGYTQVVISASASQVDQSSESVSHASAVSGGAAFWFAGASLSADETVSHFSSQMNDSQASVQIGMNVAKVGIEREWFRPEVFYLTKDMFNLTTQRISPNPQTPYTSMDDARLKDMAGGMVFPCYPTAFVVARDISVKIVSDTTISSEFADSVKEHASAGGGFLFFSGSGSSSNSFSETCAHVSSTSNSVTVRFSTPQIIGYYMEATAPDQSTYLDDVSGSAQAGYVSIAEFVEKYRIMLEEMNHNKRSGRQFL